jgi:hypothetical protein
MFDGYDFHLNMEQCKTFNFKICVTLTIRCCEFLRPCIMNLLASSRFILKIWQYNIMNIMFRQVVRQLVNNINRRLLHGTAACLQSSGCRLYELILLYWLVSPSSINICNRYSLALLLLQ